MLRSFVGDQVFGGIDRYGDAVFAYIYCRCDDDPGRGGFVRLNNSIFDDVDCFFAVYSGHYSKFYYVVGGVAYSHVCGFGDLRVVERCELLDVVSDALVRVVERL